MSLPSLILVLLLKFTRQHYSHLEGFPMVIDQVKENQTVQIGQSRTVRPVQKQAVRLIDFQIFISIIFAEKSTILDASRHI